MPDLEKYRTLPESNEILLTLNSSTHFTNCGEWSIFSLKKALILLRKLSSESQLKSPRKNLKDVKKSEVALMKSTFDSSLGLSKRKRCISVASASTERLYIK